MATRILNGWKEIAQFMGRGVRTVQRWEAIGLPIRRPNARNRSAVVAFGNELEGWLSRPEGDILHSMPVIDDPATGPFRYKALVVDDDDQQLNNEASLLTKQGYDVRTAQHGFEALAVMRAGIPDLLVSGLKMPRMSGLELLWIVRRRFPIIAVIATSREYTSATLPEVFCDSYLEHSSIPSQLLETARELLYKSPLRGSLAKTEFSPAWVARPDNGSVMLTCLACLRSFYTVLLPVQVSHQPVVDTCVHCGVDVQYRIDETRMPEVIGASKPFAVTKVYGQPVSSDMPRISANGSHAGQFGFVTPKLRNGTR